MTKNTIKIAGAMLSLLTAFSFQEAQAQTCVQPPSCEDLGYTKTETDCANADVVLKCPTDTSKIACVKIPQNISTGAIVYGDGTVSPDLIADKFPVAIVFDTVNRLAVSLTEISKTGSPIFTTMTWSSNLCDDTNLPNCTDESSLHICARDGQAHTNAILSSTCLGTTEAATATSKYQPTSCTADFCKTGKWFLPSINDLEKIYAVKNILGEQFKSLNQLISSVPSHDLLEEKKYWSSTEYDVNNAWFFTFKKGTTSFEGAGYAIKGKYSFYVRPIVKF